MDLMSTLVGDDDGPGLLGAITQAGNAPPAPPNQLESELDPATVAALQQQRQSDYTSAVATYDRQRDPWYDAFAQAQGAANNKYGENLAGAYRTMMAIKAQRDQTDQRQRVNAILADPDSFTGMTPQQKAILQAQSPQDALATLSSRAFAKPTVQNIGHGILATIPANGGAPTFTKAPQYDDGTDDNGMPKPQVKQNKDGTWTTWLNGKPVGHYDQNGQPVQPPEPGAGPIIDSDAEAARADKLKRDVNGVFRDAKGNSILYAPTSNQDGTPYNPHLPQTATQIRVAQAVAKSIQDAEVVKDLSIRSVEHQNIRNNVETTTHPDGTPITPQERGTLDISLLAQYMHALNPGRSVSEADVATLGKAGGLPGQAQRMWGQLEGSGQLTPAMRSAIVTDSANIVSGNLQATQGFMQSKAQELRARHMDPAIYLNDPTGGIDLGLVKPSAEGGGGDGPGDFFATHKLKAPTQKVQQ
jgi:hypothetical protein